MSQNITLLGASYSNVPSVELPKTGGGTAQFDDTTDANAIASDILQGKTAYVNGEKIIGTNTGSSEDGSVWQDGEGYVNLDDDPGTHVEVESYTVSSSGTHTAPTGYAYSPVIVPSGSATTPATSITANPSISVNSSTGVITASVSGSKSVTPTVSSGYVTSGTSGTVSVSGSNTSQLSTQGATTITPSTSQQTAVSAGKYTTGAVTVSAMPSGTAGTPTASKGSVSNHSVTVTPSVTNSAGYISGGTKTGTGVTVTASELVSGTTVIIDDSGNWDVTTAETAIVGAATAGTPTATKGTVSNHSVSVTPSVTNTAGYLYPGGTKTGTAVSVSASELVSGTKSITDNGTGIDVTNYESVDVSVSGGGGDEPDEKAINFYDYDGTRLYSYSTAEWASVSALPSNPTHTGLTAQGWNWTKAQIDAQLTSAPTEMVNVGQMYTTSSGDSEIDIFLEGARIGPYLCIAVNGTVTVDWGDDSSTTTVTGTSLTSRKQTKHNYPASGKYTITIHVVSGSFAFYGSSTYYLLNSQNSSGNPNRVYASCVQAVRIGSKASIGGNAFYNCCSVKYITIPNTVTEIGSASFEYCGSLKCIILPNSITSGFGGWAVSYCYSLTTLSLPGSLTYIGNYGISYNNCLRHFTIPSTVASTSTYAIAHNYILESITLPNSITALPNYMLYANYSVTRVIVPSGVTSIGDYALGNLNGVKEYHFKSTSPPTLGSSVFSGMQTVDCEIYVPEASFSDYENATGWSSYAANLIGE